MNDLTDFLRAQGVPAWIAVVLAALYILVDKLHLWPRQGKSEREILSADEITFRTALMERLKDVEGRLEKCMKGHADCQAANAKLEERLDLIVKAAAAAGIEFAVKVSPVAPIPSMEKLIS